MRKAKFNLEYNLKDSRIPEYDGKLTLSDVDKFEKVREESIKIKQDAFDTYNSKGFNNPMFYDDVDNNEEVKKKNIKWYNVIPSSFPTINNNWNCGVYQLGSLNLFAAPYTINKIPFMVNEGINALNHGSYVFHLFLDNNCVCNGMIFYVSCMIKIPQKELDPYFKPYNLSNNIKLMNRTKNNIFKRIDVFSYDSETTNTDGIIEVINKFQKAKNCHYDMIMIDSLDYLKREIGNGNYSGNKFILSKLNKYANENQSVILASIKVYPNDMSKEIFPIESIVNYNDGGEFINFLLGYNKPQSDERNSIGSIKIHKHGILDTDEIFRVETDWEFCNISEITNERYIYECESKGLLTTYSQETLDSIRKGDNKWFKKLFPHG